MEQLVSKVCGRREVHAQQAAKVLKSLLLSLARVGEPLFDRVVAEGFRDFTFHCADHQVVRDADQRQYVVVAAL